MGTAVDDLIHGFGVALQPGNLGWCLAGVVLGNVIGVLPGMGVMAAIAVLLPLTFSLPPVASLLMLAGIYYGAQYGGAICSILLNLPTHPPHAVTCLDGYPLTVAGRGGEALTVAMLASFLGASVGILQMIFLAPLLVSVALQFGPADMCALMLLGLLGGSTLARGSPLKGVTMMVLGLLLGLVGTDVNSGTQRFTFGVVHLYDGIDVVALALGLFGIGEFIKSVNRVEVARRPTVGIRVRDMRPSRATLVPALVAAVRGSFVGSLCALIPGTGPTIASFMAYGLEKRLSRTRERFGNGAIEGVAAPEAATHSAVQGDFIPTMSLGIPGDSVMALLLGALLIQGIQPGPQLISTHPDVFWGLVASFWIGNIVLVILNIPMIGIWVRMLSIPFRYLFPSAILFICLGVYGSQNDLFVVYVALGVGIAGYFLLRLGFHPAPILLGYVLGPRFEENFRRALDIAHGDLSVFVTRPASAILLLLCVLLIASAVFFGSGSRRLRKGHPASAPPFGAELQREEP